MRKLLNGDLTGPDFARTWLAARRQALDAEERVREPFQRILDAVFYLLDDYVIDPALRVPGDISDADLTEQVAVALGRLEELESR